MSPLVSRVAAAAVLAPAVVALVLFLPTPVFALVFLAFAILGAREWPVIATLTGPWRRWFWVVAALLVALAARFGTPELALGLASAAMIYWLAALGWVIQAERGHPPPGLASPLVRTAAGWATLVPCWVALVALHEIRPALVLLVLVVIWIADSAAYFAGRRFGRRRLAARVSPGKSWEGALGGLAAVAVMVPIAIATGALDVSRAPLLVGLCVAVAAISVLGDLTQSLFKRRAGVKDSGRLIPGHGGVLDRIDSLTAAAPAFLLGWKTLGLSLT